MGGDDSLQTLAEVSIALAGFGSLLVVLRRDPSRSWSAAEGVDLLIVVGGSLLVLFFSLLPLPVFHLGSSEPAVWRLASALLGLALVLAWWALMQRRWRLLRAGLEPSFPNLSRALVQLPLVLAAVLALNAADVLGSGRAGAYLLALVLLLGASAFPLVALVIRLGDDLQDHDEPPPE
jgi:hypothetical protein